jgi:plastocyanin
MNRRTLLKRGLGATALSTLAGCSASGGGGSGGEGADTTDATATTTTTATTATETAAPSTTADREDPTVIRVGTTSDGLYFDPIGLHVEPGATVTWVAENGSHTTVSCAPDHPGPDLHAEEAEQRIPEDAPGWNSDLMDAGTEFEHTLEIEGTYDYYCAPHRSLGAFGRIVVGEPGGPAEDGDYPAVPGSEYVVEEGEIPYDEFEG